MITSITLEKYKSFRETTTIDLKPLTILCGVNSSGKSSVLKSLLMMKQTVEKESPYNKLAFMGNYVDNGYFDDIINDSCTDDGFFTIKNEFVVSRYSKSQRKRQDMQSFKELNRIYSQIPNSKSIFRYKIDHFIKVAKSDSKGLLSYIDNNNIVETKIEIRSYNEFGEELNGFYGFIRLIKDTKTPNGREYFLSYENLPLNRNFISLSDDQNYRLVCYFNNIKLTNIYKEGGIKANTLNLKPTIMSLFNITSMMYTGINFIAPLRQFPSRFYTISGDVSSVGIYGENAPVLLAKLQSEPASYEISIPESFNNDIRFNKKTGYTFKQQAQKWFDYMELGDVDIKGENGQISVAFSNHNISDIGFGVSQVMPIIVQGLSIMKDELLLLEQPEIHLHPKMQMKMADFLIALADSERNLIVETHSDHIINRIVRRCLEKPDLIDKISILFLSKSDDNSTKIEDIKVDTHLGIDEAPIDFFDQYASETDAIIQNGYQNMMRDNDV